MTADKMDFDEIHQILDLMRVHGLAEFELERGDLHIRLRKAEMPLTTVPMPPGSPPVTTGAAVPASAASTPAGGEPAESGPTIVKAPILGTFYRASGPEVSPFVEVGDIVKPGDVLCIIEAMKLMNDIKSEFAGEVVTVFAENGQPVQYGERLFAIRQL
jgi:acetyl-CoA carboxylase biotin carboxyl carrier protein